MVAETGFNPVRYDLKTMRIIDKKAQKEAFVACFRKPAVKVKVLEPSSTIPKKIGTLKIKIKLGPACAVACWPLFCCFYVLSGGVDAVMISCCCSQW